jgi:hypothetical protein
MEHPRGDWTEIDGRKCSDLGCGGRVFVKNLCKKCYERKRRAELATKTCTENGCSHVRFRRTLCQRHYHKLNSIRIKRPKCSISHCFEHPTKGSRYCVDHDSVYGEGVSKHTRQNLTHEAILRCAIETQKILESANFPVLSLDLHQLV